MSEQPADVDAADLESATPRGLAAGLISHLSGFDVTYVGGSDAGGAISVMVGTDNSELETVHLFVQADVGAIACGSDAGYSSTSCDVDNVSSTEVLVRKSDDGEMPTFIGRFHDMSRRNVLIQVWGSGGEDAESLVRELLLDPLVGAVTSRALNDEGEQLTDFDQLQIEQSSGPR